MAKPKIIKDYEKVSEELLMQIKLEYPRGFRKHLVSFIGKDGEKRKGLPFETDDYYYLIRMSPEKASFIIENDDDYNDAGELKKGVKKDYEDELSDDDEDLGDINEAGEEFNTAPLDVASLEGQGDIDD